MFSLRHFLIFKTVSETENFTKAAQKLYITQSAVSHAIRDLEDYTGTILFDRLSKQVRLTSGGKLLLEEVTPILSACDSLEKRMGQLPLQAPLYIVSSITIAAFWLPQILLEVKRQLPDTPVSVKVVSAAEAIQTLRSGDADLAFVEGIVPKEPFLSRLFADYPLKIVCSPSYPCANDALKIEDFCSNELLLRETGSAIRDTLDSQLFLSGYSARPSWVSVNSTALIEAAKAGLGITVLPEVLVRDAIAEHTLIPLEVGGLNLKNNLYAVWHKEKHLTPALKTLLACIPDQMQENRDFITIGVIHHSP